MNDYKVDRKKWSSLSIFEQMGNIYSEVGRSFNAKRAQDNEQAEQAMLRAIDLFDATAEVLQKKGSPKLKEVLRAKEEYTDAMFDKGTAAKDLASLDRYFMQFAVAARLHL